MEIKFIWIEEYKNIIKNQISDQVQKLYWLHFRFRSTYSLS